MLKHATMLRKLNYPCGFMLTSNLYKFPMMKVNVKYETVQKINLKLKSEESFSQKFYEEIIKILPRTNNGSMQLKRELFYKGLNEAKNEGDIEYLLYIVADFMGNHCPLSGNTLDDYLKRTIEMGCPNKLIPLLQNHRALLYYPSPSLILRILKLHEEKKDWNSMKAFYEAVGKRYYIKKQTPFYDIYIQSAYNNKDYDQCVEAFIDILDYQETRLETDTYNKIIYSNSKLIQDIVFVEIFEKVVSSVDHYGILFAFMVYYKHMKNDDKLNHYMQKLEHYSFGNDTQPYVLENDLVLNFFKDNSEKSEENSKFVARLTNILSRTPLSVFAPAYQELVSKIMSPEI